MNALEREIRALIESEGPIPVSHYMQLCLAHPRYGYYMTRDPLGEQGDFVTAPEVSQMFGELIGVWCAEVWRAMDEPARIILVELGPGRGTLMADILRAAKIVPAFRAAVSVHLVETSPALSARQHQALGDADVAVEWHSSVNTLPGGPLVAVANEFVDAIPVDQFVRTESGWHERRIGLVDDRLAFALSPVPAANMPDPLFASAPAGSIVELRDLTPVTALAQRIAGDGGGALLIDYGHIRSAPGETLQAVRRHRFADPLERPGEADLTAHVDFEQLARSAQLAGTHTVGPVTQGDFLREMGIELRAERLKRGQSQETVAKVDEAVARLTGTFSGMGELFKVLGVMHPSLPSPPGFDTGRADSNLAP